MPKVLVTFPDELLERIDRVARQRGTSRSRFLQDAANRELCWPEAVTMDAALARARSAMRKAGTFESAELIARERQARDAADRRRQ